ncbi:Avr9/Cf-9 rapidly elicited protein [Hirschfeldia incana]|nr:Avr9/Cf-9 rapidly elicited protein [Hirschfeldia incana]
MNSMFSPFDAMSAEIMGKKVTAASYICNPSERNAASSTGQTASSLKKDEKATSLAKKQPRYALELDGIHCFETIVRS